MRSSTVLTAACFFALLAGCGGSNEDDAAPATTAPPASSQTAVPEADGAPATATAPAADVIPANVRVVGLDGKPEPGMMPIVTRQPNAFDPYIAAGRPTGDDGESVVPIPREEHLYVRAWDPAMKMFANNFVEVWPKQGNVAKDIQIQMVEGATLRARLVGADRAPAAGENVGLMMLHDTFGPWWPAEGDTSADGAVRFSRVPAGKFLIKLKAVKSGQVEVADVFLPPGGETDLGTLLLR